MALSSADEFVFVLCSMRSSPSSGPESSMELPPSPFQLAGGQIRQPAGMTPEERLNRLLGPIANSGPPVPARGFSTVLSTALSGASDMSRHILPVTNHVIDSHKSAAQLGHCHTPSLHCSVLALPSVIWLHGEQDT